MVENANLILSTLTLIGGIGSIVLLVILLIYKRQKKAPRFLQKLLDMLSRYSLLAIFVVSLIATLGSLFFSEVAHYTPCKLCWYQRILMYPQVLLAGAAIIKQDKKIFDYFILLSGVGALIAAYHYYIQVGGTEFFPCSTVGFSVSCTEKFVMSYGYITIPMMALTAFVMILLLSISAKIFKKNK